MAKIKMSWDQVVLPGGQVDVAVSTERLNDLQRQIAQQVLSAGIKMGDKKVVRGTVEVSVLVEVFVDKAKT